MKEYGLYDMKDYEQCVCIGSIKEIANFLDCSTNSLRSFITHRKKGERQGLLRKKYELIEISEDGEEIPIKSDKEIFNELIKSLTELEQITTLKEEIDKFEVFDYFKWELKGRLNQVMEFEEEWKQIPGFDYSISNYGHIRNDKTGKLKSLRIKNFIVSVDIYKDGKRFTINVPRAEVMLFIRVLDKEERVIHKDGDSRNNYVENLKIVSM